MNALVVDTSSWVEYFKSGKQEVIIEDALSRGQLLVPSLVVAEILSGKLSAKDRTNMMDFLSDLSTIGEGFNHWVSVGDLRSKLANKGFTVSTPDAHVAQVCLEHSAALLSEDAIFKKIAGAIGLKVI